MCTTPVVCRSLCAQLACFFTRGSHALEQPQFSHLLCPPPRTQPLYTFLALVCCSKHKSAANGWLTPSLQNLGMATTATPWPLLTRCRTPSASALISASLFCRFVLTEVERSRGREVERSRETEGGTGFQRRANLHKREHTHTHTHTHTTHADQSHVAMILVC